MRKARLYAFGIEGITTISVGLPQYAARTAAVFISLVISRPAHRAFFTFGLNLCLRSL
jgi:hypothetical protein